MNLKGQKINFLGDSITEGHGSSEYSKCYVARIAELSGATCRNYGIGGTRIAQKRIPSPEPRWDLDFCSRVEEMDSDADIVVVFGGTNDFGHGDAPLGTMEDRTKDTFYGALHTLYISLLEKYTESTIVVLTPTHRLGEDITITPERRRPPLKAFVNAVREVAEYYSLPVLDLFAAGGIQPEVEPIRLKYMPDGLHPNDAGYQVLAAKILAFLESL